MEPRLNRNKLIGIILVICLLCWKWLPREGTVREVAAPSLVGEWQMAMEGQGSYGTVCFQADETYSMSGCSGWGDWNMDGSTLMCAFGGDNKYGWNLEWSHGGNVVHLVWNKKEPHPLSWKSCWLRRI